MVKLIQEEIDFINRVERMISDLEKEPDYSLYNAFRLIDKYDEGHISIANL